MSRFRLAPCVGACLVLFGWCGQTGAQTPTSEPIEVVVSATRFQARPLASPVLAQVITAEDIEKSSATTVAEVLSQLGGVHTRISTTGLPDAPLDLRGFGLTGDQNTLVLINGVRISENEGISARLSSVPVNAIEKIEILPGSGAVLYGAGATGGTINIVTRAPVDEGTRGAVSLAGGSYQMQDARARLQVRQGLWGVSVHGQDYQSNNYRRGNRAQSQAVSGELRYGDQDDYLALNFAADDQSSDLPGVRKINLVTGLNEFVNDPRGVTTPDDFIRSQSESVTLRGERKLSQGTLAFDVYQRQKSRRSFGTYDWGGTSSSQSHTRVSGVSPRWLWSSRDWPWRHHLTLGGDWSDWTHHNSTQGTMGSETFSESGQQSQRAFYLRNDMLGAHGTRLSWGYRDETVSQSNDLTNLDLPSASSQRVQRARLTASEVALEQRLPMGLAIFGRWGESFRIANIDENRCVWGGCPGLLRPQVSQQTELGLQWRDLKAQARLALFNIRSRDEIHYNALTGNNENLPPTQRQGLELQSRVKLTPKLDLGGQYVWTQAQFQQGVYSSYMNFQADLSGRTVPMVPKHRWQAHLGWQMDTHTRLSTVLRYVGQQRFDNDQANHFMPMPSYATLDLKLARQVGAWHWSLGVNNLADKAYYSYGVTNVALSPSRMNVYPEPRRNAYISGEYRF